MAPQAVATTLILVVGACNFGCQNSEMKLGNVLSMGLRRIEQELREAVYIRTGRDATRPHVIQAMPTQRCNYKCLSCGCWRQEEPESELTLEEWQTSLASLRSFVGAMTVQFAGGEPFVYKPFVPLVEWCAAHDIGWGVITNGSAFTKEISRRVVAAQPVNISISVDGASAAVHDDSRGVRGSLAQIEKNIGHLREARDRAGARFPIRIKPVVHRRNLQEMPAAVEWAVKAGATTIDFNPVRHWTPEVETMLWVEEPDLPALQKVIDQLIEAKRQGAPIETEESKLRAMVDHFRGVTVRPSVAPCRAGLREYHINAVGDIFSCWYYPTIGNVREGLSAQEVWQGKKAAGQRHMQMTCSRFGSNECASSCLAHRTMGQDWQRVKMMLRRH